MFSVDFFTINYIKIWWRFCFFGEIILFTLFGYIGEGAYSSVYQVRRIADRAVYALKKVKMVKLSDKEKENALNEVRILASIKHHNIS